MSKTAETVPNKDSALLIVKKVDTSHRLGRALEEEKLSQPNVTVKVFFLLLLFCFRVKLNKNVFLWLADLESWKRNVKQEKSIRPYRF